jgi:phosphoglycerol transferase MdoB-like AlkP superfamily enzyme
VAQVAQSKSTRFIALYLAILPWIPAAAATMFIKLKLIGGGAPYEESQTLLMVREAGRVDAGGFAAWGRLIDQLSFYRSDLLWALWVVPAILIGAAVALPVRMRAWFVAACSSAAIAILYFQRQAEFGAGRFVSWQTLADSAAWGIAHPGEIGNYLQPGGLARASVLIASVAGLAFISGRLAARSGAPLVRYTTAAVLAVFTILTATAWRPVGVIVWAHTGVYQRVAVAMLEIEQPPPAVTSGDPVKLASAYRALVNAPDEAVPSQFDGKASGYNLILVVLETTPTRILDLSGPLDRLPNLRRLRENAWIGPHHHTTHPRSDRAFFSILTSIYSADLDRIFSVQRQFSGGFLNGLKQRGYHTGLYLPNGDVFDFETSMWRTLGFETLVEPAPKVNEPDFWSTDWKIRDRLDHEALWRMLDDIRGLTARNEPFATVFYPQLGHAPWPDILKDGREPNLQRRGEEILIREDRLFGEIIDALNETGAMDNTLIVVTGDHGIRSRPEDPDIPVGKIDAYSFQVPFLLYAPGIIEATESLDWITSHIDIGPTISALFGLEPAPSASQGSPVWDGRIRDRTTFFWSLDYHGAAGFSHGAGFAMWNSFYDRVYLSDVLAFDAANAVPNDSTDYSFTKGTIRKMDEINTRWVEALFVAGEEAPALE